jgi:DNA-binding transcriptional LysR family regulator
MTYRDLLYIVTILDEGSVSAAANRLNISQPSLSQAVSKLESQIGMKLFLRYGKHLAPTQFGSFFAARAREVLGNWEVFEQEVNKYIIEKKKNIIVGAPAGLCRTLLPYVLSELEKDHPELKITVLEQRSVEIEQHLFEGSLDLGVLHSPLYNPNIGNISCFTTPDMLGVSRCNSFVKSHPYRDLDHLTTVSLNDLGDTPFVMMRHKKADVLINGILSDSGFCPNICKTTSIWFNVVDYIKNGDYAGFVDEMTVNHDRDDKDVAWYRIDTHRTRTTYVAFHPARKLTRQEFFFIEYVKRYHEFVERRP